MHPDPSVASEIPLDVLEVIFRYLPASDLYACCRVNKAMHSIAFEAIYRDLQPKRRNIMPLCLKLCNDTSLARRVRSFVLFDDTVDMYLGILQDTLPLLTRLHTLILFIGPSSSWILPQADKCHFQLTTFSSSFFYDAALASFLLSQRSLKHLRVTGYLSLSLFQSIKPNFLPNLVSIRVPLYLATVLVPGRPIRDIVTSHTHQHVSISPLSLSTSNNGVQRLMVNFSYLQEEGCEQVAQAVPNLTNLTIDADNVVPDDPVVCDVITGFSAN